MAEEAAVLGRLRLTLVTYEKKVLELECDEVTLPGKLGYFGVLPGHVPMISTLKVGELMYRVGKVEHYLALSSGFCEVADDEVTVMAEFAELPQDIDVAAAEREQSEAEAVLGSASDEDLKRALAKLETAVTRIQVASRAR
ncbi:MAG TPA: F0F1 ATP synthase subunit epsilon [Thermoanaerobaculia bacterium]|nr:F0F1 ATP synthase subunit epsilon [Thermoanaerobaculia bacterium]